MDEFEADTSAPSDKPFALSAAELRSVTWRNLMKFMQARVAALREQNDNDLDDIRTAKLRGRIAGFQELLALGASPDPATEADEEQGE